MMLKRGTLKCPTDKTPLEWSIRFGMVMIREIEVEKPKHNYYVYDARCPNCNQNFEVKR